MKKKGVLEFIFLFSLVLSIISFIPLILGATQYFSESDLYSTSNAISSITNNGNKYLYSDHITASKACSLLTGGAKPLAVSMDLPWAVNMWGSDADSVYWDKPSSTWVTLSGHSMRYGGTDYCKNNPTLSVLTCSDRVSGDYSPLDATAPADIVSVPYASYSGFYPLSDQNQFAASIATGKRLCALLGYSDLYNFEPDVWCHTYGVTYWNGGSWTYVGSGSGWSYAYINTVDGALKCRRCTPTTCAILGKNCGTFSDGCGGTLTCGTCSSGYTCNSGVCQCVPATCASLGKNCGTFSDGCGGTLTCGTCSSGYTCNSGVCQCTPNCNLAGCSNPMGVPNENLWLDSSLSRLTTYSINNIDSSGSHIWFLVRAIETDSSGNIYVNGLKNRGPFTTPFNGYLTYSVTAKFSPSKTLLWIKNYEGESSWVNNYQGFQAFNMTLDGSANVYVFGAINGVNGLLQTLKYDTNGNLVGYKSGGNANSVNWAMDISGTYSPSTPGIFGPVCSKSCGDDGCSGSCGSCSSGYSCNISFQCAPNCVNDCTSGQKRCNANNVETCGNYDADSCVEWGVSTTCLSGRTCNSTSFDCQLGLVSSYSSSTALLNSQYFVKCNFGVSGLSCVSAGSSCSFQSYEGTNVTFVCTASPLGPQSNYCNLINNAGIQGCIAKTNSITATSVIECSSDSDCTSKGSCSRCDLLSHTCVSKSAGTVCRASAGVCDATETCSGSSMACPGDSRVSSGTVCRAASGNCDLSETCDGSSINCPSDLKQPNGLTCTGINKCYPYTCQSGTCTQGGTQINCNDGRSCTIDDCDPGIGCVYDNSNCQCTTAAQCDDSNPCTVDSCASEMCQHTPGNLGAICRASVGPCDISEICDGTSANCPVQTFNSSMTICRGASGVCDATERCSGTGPDCSADLVLSSNTTCRAVYHECDSSEFCNGILKTCPVDSNLSNGASCSSDNCTTNRTCTYGVCSGGTPILPKPSGCSCTGNSTSTCDEAGFCQEAACVSGNCEYTPSNVFVDDGDKCKSNRQCVAGSFTFDVKDCVSTNECEDVRCNNLTGNCDKVNKADGTACFDSYCYSNRICTAGICMGGNPKSSPVPVGCGLSSLSIKAASLDFFNFINLIEVIVILGIFYFVYRLHKNKNKKKSRKKK